MYHEGQGVQQDNLLSVMWLTIATLHTTGEDAKTYSKLRDLVATTMNLEQIEEALRLAQDWMKRAMPTKARTDEAHT